MYDFTEFLGSFKNEIANNVKFINWITVDQLVEYLLVFLEKELESSKNDVGI